MSNHELESKIRELRQIQSLIEEAQAEAESIRFDTVLCGCYNGFAKRERCDDMERFTWWDRLKAEFRSFASTAGGKMMIFMLVLGIVAVIILFWALTWF